MNFLIYSTTGIVTGRRLGDYLGVQHGTEAPSETRPRHLIRWGSSRRVPYRPAQDVWNKRRAVNANTNKYQALQTMQDAGVPTPPASRHYRDITPPALGRSRNHTGGTDIDLILQDQDAELGDHHHYVEYIPVDKEYRLHVAGGELLKASWKRLEEPGERVPWMRNHESGWHYVNPRDSHNWRSAIPHAVRAVDALDLDFGAVDLIKGDDELWRVLEVNTAPSLIESSLQLYGDAIAEMVGLSGYPGMREVEWDDD